MVPHSLRLVAILALQAAAPPVAAAAPAVLPTEAVAPSARDAAAVVDAFHAALRRGDTAAASGLLADEVLVFEDGRAERSKAEYGARHLGADAEFSRAVPGARTRRRGDSAGNFAWIATEGRTKGRYRGTEINQVTDETVVLRRIAGEWKIVHIHWSSAQSAVE